MKKWLGQLELGSGKIQSLAQDDLTTPHKTKTSASAKAAPEKKSADAEGLNYNVVGPTRCNDRKPKCWVLDKMFPIRQATPTQDRARASWGLWTESNIFQGRCV